MQYLLLFVFSFLLLTSSPSYVEDKSAAMKSLKQKYAQDHKTQPHEVNHTLKKPLHLPKATPLTKN